MQIYCYLFNPGLHIKILAVYLKYVRLVLKRPAPATCKRVARLGGEYYLEGDAEKYHYYQICTTVLSGKTCKQGS